MDEEIHDEKGLKSIRLKVRVNINNIEMGIEKSSSHCMISDAVKDAAKLRGLKVGRVKTDLQTIRFTALKTRVRYVYFTPPIGQRRLLQFDQGVKPEPFEFSVNPVQIIPPRIRGERHKAQLRYQTKPRKTDGGGGDGRTRPIKIGGEALRMVGARREFGLRAMGVWKPPTEVATAVEAS